MLCLRILVLFKLCTLLNAIVCCLQLNTGRGADANVKVDYLVTDACWIAVCVLCRNAQMNLIVVIMSCICIVMNYLFVNCPAVICSPSMLFISYGETPLVNCGPRSILYTDNTTYFKPLFSLHCETTVETNIIFHTIRLILCFQQDR